MIRNKDFIKYFRFEKTIEDLFYDSESGIFAEMGETEDEFFVHNNVPQFIVDGIFDLNLLDVSFYDKYSERFLNKTSANEYSIGLDGELVNPSDLSRLTQQILDYFCKKWDNLYYLYYTIVMGEDYNPIENYSSHEKTTYNNLKDELSKTGSEKSSQKSEIKQKPLKTTRSILDEYGEKDNQGNYTKGIKDTTEYKRNYTTTDTAGSVSGGTTVPFTTEEETKIAGFNSADYSNSEKRTRKESGVRGSSGFADATGSGESTERTGKHSSITVDGGKLNSDGTVSEDSIQTVTEMNPDNNFSELSFTDRKDTNTRTGNFEVDKSGNIGTMTPADMLNKFLESDYIRVTYLDLIFKDLADFISLKCY